MEYKGPFEKEIIARTLNILGGYIGPYEDTLFLNLCVGLLIIPKESLYSKLPEEDISDSKWSIDPHLISFEKSDDRSVKSTIRHMRNAIAHNGILFENNSGVGKDITHIIIEDKSGGQQTFKAVIEITKFRDFILKVANFALQYV